MGAGSGIPLFRGCLAPGGGAAPGTPEFEIRLKMIYDMLRAAGQENSAREMAARRTAAETKNPPAPGGAARGGENA